MQALVLEAPVEEGQISTVRRNNLSLANLFHFTSTHFSVDQGAAQELLHESDVAIDEYLNFVRVFIQEGHYRQRIYSEHPEGTALAAAGKAEEKNSRVSTFSFAFVLKYDRAGERIFSASAPRSDSIYICPKTDNLPRKRILRTRTISTSRNTAREWCLISITKPGKQSRIKDSRISCRS